MKFVANFQSILWFDDPSVRTTNLTTKSRRRDNRAGVIESVTSNRGDEEWKGKMTTQDNRTANSNLGIERLKDG